MFVSVLAPALLLLASSGPAAAQSPRPTAPTGLTTEVAGTATASPCVEVCIMEPCNVCTTTEGIMSILPIDTLTQISDPLASESTAVDMSIPAGETPLSTGELSIPSGVTTPATSAASGSGGASASPTPTGSGSGSGSGASTGSATGSAPPQESTGAAPLLRAGDAVLSGLSGVFGLAWALL